MIKRFFAVAFLFAVPTLAARLPQTVTPQHSRITLTPDLATEKFFGDETSDIEKALPPFVLSRSTLALSRFCTPAERDDGKAFLAAQQAPNLAAFLKTQRGEASK